MDIPRPGGHHGDPRASIPCDLGPAALTGLALLGCNPEGPVPDPGTPGLQRIGSCGELRDYAGT